MKEPPQMQRVTPLPTMLSEALRQGSTLHPQIRIWMFSFKRVWEPYEKMDPLTGKISPSGENTYPCDGCCVWGAIYAAIFGTPPDNKESQYMAQLREYFAEEQGLDLQKTVIHPITGEEKELELVLIDLNDYRGWTFDQMITWLESIEL